MFHKKVFIPVLLVILLYAPPVLLSQPVFNWAISYGSSAPTGDQGEAIALDDSGNVYVTGYFHGSPDFDPGPGVYSLSVPAPRRAGYIAKYTASGNLVWAKACAGDETTDIALDHNGNIYVTGVFYDSADFDPGPGVYMLSSASSSVQVYVVKLDNAGNFIWAKFVNSNSADLARSLVLDSQDNVYVLGDFSGHADFDPGPDSAIIDFYPNGWDIFVWKLDSDGNYIWAKRIGGNWVDSGDDMAIDKQDNIYFTGKFMSMVDFDPGPGSYDLYSTLYDEIFVCKLNSDGNFVYAKQFGADGRGLSLDVDEEGNVVFAGFFKATVDFDPGPGTHYITSSGSWDAFLAKLDKSGNLAWVQQYGDSIFGFAANSVVLDAHSNIYLTGWFQRTVDFDPGPAIHNAAGDSTADLYLTQLDAAGNFLMVSHLNGSAYEGGYAMALSCGSLYITGGFSGTVDFDPGADTSMLTANTGLGGDAFITRYDLHPLSAAALTANADTVCSGAPVSLGVSGNNESGSNWEWYESSCGGIHTGTGNEITVYPSSTNTYFVRAENECESGDCTPVTVFVKETPVASFDAVYTICCGGIKLNCRNESQNAESYLWNFNDGSTSTELNAEHIYNYNTMIETSLIAINNNGCRDTFRLQNFATLRDWLNLTVPNVYTPNGDGINDALSIHTDADIGDCFSFSIYNEWGTKVFSTKNIHEGWNGNNHNGSEVAPGTYYYIVEISDAEYKGFVTVLK
jgi:gliding motility-associated-like protein